MFKRARSSVTGRFVTLWYAIRHPKTTVVETVEKPPAPIDKARKDMDDGD